MRWLALILAVPTIASPPFEYREALPHYVYSFPRDHFEHPAFRTEWWYYTGNLYTASHERFGFELVFFRQGQHTGVANPSVWRADDLYLAHAALTDLSARAFTADERLNRAGPGIAGASFTQQRIWNGNWSAIWHSNGQQTLTCLTPHFSFTFNVEPATAPVIHGIGGISQKAEGIGHASHYVSLPRLNLTGTVIAQGHSQAVTGRAWMDHEWFSHQLDTAQSGWDWFSIQLDSGANLMLYRFRRKDGSLDPYSSGTFIAADGRTTHLTAADFHLQPLDYWQSPTTHARYPIHWQIEVPRFKLKLDCRAALPNQELTASHGGPTYWEGAVDYTGSGTGVGYLEMTGYDKAFTMN